MRDAPATGGPSVVLFTRDATVIADDGPDALVMGRCLSPADGLRVAAIDFGLALEWQGVDFDRTPTIEAPWAMEGE